MRIDSSLMFCAISRKAEAAGAPDDSGYLNRRNGEIIFLYDREGAADAMIGEGAAVEQVFDRATLDSSPDDWVEIPKYDRRVEECDEGTFIERFLRDNGIDATVE